MIGDLNPYPEMKESGVPWLGQMPAHWEVRRNGRLFGQRNETGYPDLPILEVSLRTGVRIRDLDSGLRKQVMGDFGKYKRAAAGDIAYNMMRMWQGAVGVVPTDGLVSPAYVVAAPYPEANPRYYDYLFRTTDYMREVNKFSRGIVSDRNRLYWGDFKQMPSPFPPSDEQAAIVRFLTHADRRIRRAIRVKRKMIALLNEQRQAIIHQAVTRGPDPDMRLKPSGVEWLGDVPEHWEVRKLKHCGDVIGGMTPSMEERRYWDGDIPWVTPKDMKRNSIKTSSVRITADALRETSLRLIEYPAILLVVRGMILARRVPIACTAALVTINQDMKALRVWVGINAQFLALAMEAAQSELVTLIDEAGHGTRRLPTEQWRNLSVPLPPECEQIEIINYVAQATHKIGNTIDRTELEITLLREFHIRLVADLVTGKLDVRDASTHLPEVEDQPELLDATDELEDREESALDAETEAAKEVAV